MMGLFCQTSFLTMMWCPKHFQGMYFHPPSLTKISKKFMKKFFLNFWHYFKFDSFLRIFSLLNYIQKMTETILLTMSLVNKWWPNYMNDKIREKYFSYFVQTLSSLEEQINLNIALFNHCLSHFLYII